MSFSTDGKQLTRYSKVFNVGGCFSLFNAYARSRVSCSEFKEDSSCCLMTSITFCVGKRNYLVTAVVEVASSLSYAPLFSSV